MLLKVSRYLSHGLTMIQKFVNWLFSIPRLGWKVSPWGLGRLGQAVSRFSWCLFWHNIQHTEYIHM